MGCWLGMPTRAKEPAFAFEPLPCWKMSSMSVALLVCTQHESMTLVRHQLSACSTKHGLSCLPFGLQSCGVICVL